MAGNQFRLSEEQQALRDTVRRLAEERIAPFAAEVDRDARFPQEARDALNGSGLIGLGIPEQYEGQGGDSVDYAILTEEVARVDASASLIPAVNKLGTLPMLIAATEEQKAAWLPPIARGEEMVSYCLSEAGAGSDAAGMKTLATRVDGGWRLNGTKFWITNAGVSAQYVVYAKTDPDAGPRGISAFLVRTEDEGVSFGKKEEKLGIAGSPTRAVNLDDVVVSDERLIGEPGKGFAIAMATLDRSRVTIGAQALGIGQGALDYALGYVREREQFGKPIGAFQGLQFMIADMAMQLEAARALVYQAAAMADREDPQITKFGAMAKAFASDVAMRVTTDAVQLLGGYGYVREYPVERMMRDAKITQIYEGTNQIQRVVIARQLLGRL